MKGSWAKFYKINICIVISIAISVLEKFLMKTYFILTRYFLKMDGPVYRKYDDDDAAYSMPWDAGRNILGSVTVVSSFLGIVSLHMGHFSSDSSNLEI